MIRGRFAPTPSGPMHLGNAYTALTAWLQVRSAGGAFVLRIEDLDHPRSKPHWKDLILTDLRWLGLHWDEGPDCGGPFAPYEQSRRLALYETAFQRLAAQHQVYPCFCSRQELLSAAQAPHGLSSEGAAYPGTCRHLTEEERRQKARHKNPSYRFTADAEHPVVFQDGFLGTVEFPPGAGGDFVIKRADGIYGYQLAVVVDDAAMGITDCVRGADLTDSTPRQLWLYKALGLTPPRFTHIPLLCDPQGERLSKRHRSLAISELRQAGWRPEEIIGLLAWISGWIDRWEPLTAQELIPTFDLTKLPPESIRLPVLTSPLHSSRL